MEFGEGSGAHQSDNEQAQGINVDMDKTDESWWARTHGEIRGGVLRRFCGGKDVSILELWNIFDGKDRRLSKKATPDDYLKVANILALYFFACGYDTPRKGKCLETLHAGADEEVRDYWISVLVPDALGVVYRAPVNPVKAQRGGDDVVQRVVRTAARVRNISCRSAASVSASAPKRQPRKKQKQATPPESDPETETDGDVSEARKKHTPPPTSGKRARESSSSSSEKPDHHSAYQSHHSYQWDQFDQNYHYTGHRASSYMPEADRTSVDGGHTRRSLQMQIDPRELIDRESFWRSMVGISTTEHPTVSAFPYEENQDIHIDVPAQEEEFDNPPRRVKKQSTALRTPYISTMPTPIKAAARNAYINWRKKRPTPFVRTLATHFELDHEFFDRVENMQSAMDATIIDLFCEAMVAKLERGKQLLDGVDAGSTRIVGPSFFVIFVCCVSEHWLTVLLDLIEWRVDVYDSVFHRLAPEESKLRGIQLRPLTKLMKQVLHYVGWFVKNVHDIRSPPSPSLPCRIMTNNFKQKDDVSCGPYACMYVDRLITGSPMIKWGDKTANIRDYRFQMAVRIFDLCYE
ncbi:hypothetical protein C2S52_021576 [Perilla frutescens var. hirtella]|nr:hypothetical protein C2S52_021576 [Perilla frutescens var. hirtella]